MHYPHQQWRLLITPASIGAWNMALDEAILETMEHNAAPATLRLYAWIPPCLSIGYAQPCNDIDFSLLKLEGWDWVRRPTGGRAILHTDELTYSVIAPQSDPRVSGGILESYLRLSTALVKALNLLGIKAETQPNTTEERKQANAPVCFEVPSNYEIIVDGKKLIGSAQARRKNAVLQHGTFPLSGDLTRITQGLRFDDETHRMAAASRLLLHATTAENVLGNNFSWESVLQAFISGFESELNIQLVSGEITITELERAKRLQTEKYQHPSWLMRL